MYEISPYATFSVSAPNNSRSVTTSTLDYTMQFKTFGHIEDEEHNMFKSATTKLTWHKNRYYNHEGKITTKPYQLFLTGIEIEHFRFDFNKSLLNTEFQHFTVEDSLKQSNYRYN